MQRQYLTSKCNHNQRGRCINCLSKKLKQQKSKIQNQLQEKPRVLFQQSHLNQITNKCNHSKKAKCINCIPAEQRIFDKCNHGPFFKCSKCIQRLYYITFSQYLEKLNFDCSHKKPCLKCVPSQALNYFINKNCKNHIPYPQAMCNSCIPPTVTILKQKYTHVKQVIINTWDINQLASASNKNFIGILYGKQNKQTIEVTNVYFPKYKINQNNKQIEILEDQFNQKLKILTEALNIQPVGILFDSVDLFHQHIHLSIKYQQIYKKIQLSFQISRFITIRLIRHPQSYVCQGVQCYMISDQLQTLKKNNLIYNLANSNNFGLQIAVDKNDNLPTFLRNGIQTDRMSFEQGLVWIPIKQKSIQQITINKFPYFNKQSQSLSQLQKYYEIEKKLQQPSLKYKNFQFLLKIAKQLSLELAINFAITTNQEQMKQLQSSLAKFINQKKTLQLISQN